jgi:hypothetical protein
MFLPVDQENQTKKCRLESVSLSLAKIKINEYSKIHKLNLNIHENGTKFLEF